MKGIRSNGIPGGLRGQLLARGGGLGLGRRTGACLGGLSLLAAAAGFLGGGRRGRSCRRKSSRRENVFKGRVELMVLGSACVALLIY